MQPRKEEFLFVECNTVLNMPVVGNSKKNSIQAGKGVEGAHPKIDVHLATLPEGACAVRPTLFAAAPHAAAQGSTDTASSNTVPKKSSKRMVKSLRTVVSAQNTGGKCQPSAQDGPGVNSMVTSTDAPVVRVKTSMTKKRKVQSLLLGVDGAKRVKTHHATPGALPVPAVLTDSLVPLGGARRTESCHVLLTAPEGGVQKDTAGVKKTHSAAKGETLTAPGCPGAMHTIRSQDIVSDLDVPVANPMGTASVSCTPKPSNTQSVVAVIKKVKKKKRIPEALSAAIAPAPGPLAHMLDPPHVPEADRTHLEIVTSVEKGVTPKSKNVPAKMRKKKKPLSVALDDDNGA
jgi:hypothetical protein